MDFTIKSLYDCLIYKSMTEINATLFFIIKMFIFIEHILNTRYTGNLNPAVKILYYITIIVLLHISSTTAKFRKINSSR